MIQRQLNSLKETKAMTLRPYAGTFDEMNALPVDIYIIPWSGGLDSSYLLHRLKTDRPDSRRIAVKVRWNGNSDAQDAELAAKLGAEFVDVDGRSSFFQEFALPAIRHGALYCDRFPVSSSLTRPLIAREVQRVWSEVGGKGAIAHSATHMQNTARRFERSWAALAPGAPICAPYIGSNLTRKEKTKALTKFGFTPEQSVYSIDATPVARVIENDTLEDPSNVIPDQGIFEWTRDIAETPDLPEVVAVRFDGGVPVALNNDELSLPELIERLNELGGRHGVGRYSGLEDTGFNVKNHEIREAPAMAILIEARRTLENAVLTEEEMLAKHENDQRWTRLVVGGGWFDDLTAACSAFTDRLEYLVMGRVELSLHKGTVRTRSVSSPNSLSYMAFKPAYENLVQSQGPALMANTRDVPVLLRGRHPRT